jgi:hypothetical protein
MTLLIEDTARNNLAAWTIEASRQGNAAGAVLSPFSTPRTGNSYKQSARQTIQRLASEGIEAWFDPETHALQMPTVGDFRYYDAWPLWGGTRGELDNAAEMRDHVERVFAEQDSLDVPHIAPTILLHSPQSPTSQRSLELAQIAIDLDPDARLALVGDSPFWASGSNLDGHVGGLAQLGAQSWSLTVVRPFSTLPVQAVAEEIHGLCRTTRALSEDAVVHISHGDLAGLPAVAAGAATLGTGWDPRQRVSAYASYAARTAGDGGQWFQQATLEGLLSLLTRGEAASLYAQDRPLATRLLPGTVPPDAREAFLHHVDVLTRIVSALQLANPEDAYRDMRTRYATAATDWPRAAAALGVASRANRWLTEVSRGLRFYGRTDGY